MQDVVLWESENGVSSGKIQLSDNIYNYKKILICVKSGSWISCPIIEGNTKIENGMIAGMYTASDSKCIVAISVEIVDEGNSLEIKNVNQSYSD